MRSLDFLVIGAQKAGTTSLWQYLRGHPRICMPASKEATIFSAPGPIFDRFGEYMEALFGDAPAGSLLGKATPDYMIGEGDVDVETVVERIASTVPEVKLIALLRDPVERAISAYAMAVRRGQERRSAEAALSDQLDPAQLAGARERPDPTNTYVVGGEYGRALSAYRIAFPARQLLIAYTEDLARGPDEVVDEVLGFLGLPPGYRSDNLGILHFRGGTRKLLDPESERELLEYHRTEILPQMRGSPHLNRLAFDFFLETWNVVPDKDPPSVSTDLRTRLERHFVEDARTLVSLGIDAPWVCRWEPAARGNDRKS